MNPAVQGVEFAPPIIVIGDRTSWSISLPEFPNNVYTADITFRYGTVDGQYFTVVGSAGATLDVYNFVIPVTVLIPILNIDIAWQAYIRTVAFPATTRHTLGTGRSKFLRDFSATNVIEYESIVRRTYNNLQAVIEGKASKDQLSYSIAGRSLERYSPSELLEWLSYYRGLVKQEDDALAALSGKKQSTLIKARFTDV